MAEEPTPLVRSPTLTGSRRTLLVVLVNLTLVAAYIWSRTEATPVSVSVEQDRLVAHVSNLTLTAPILTPVDGRVGLYLAPPESIHYVGWTTARPPVIPFELPILASLWWEGDWGPTTIVSGGQEPRLLDWRRDGVAGTEATRYLDRREVLTSPGSVARLFEPSLRPPVEVHTSLLRGRHGGGVFVGAADGAGYVFAVRPAHHDAAWWAITPGGWSGPLANGTFERPALATIQELIHLLLRGYPAGALLLLGAVLVTWVGRRFSAASRPFSANVADEPGGRIQPHLAGKELARSKAGEVRAEQTNVPLVLSLGGATFIVTALVATVLLEGIPHVQDSVAYLFQAKLFAAGRLWAPVPDLAEFFEHEFVLMYEGRWFSIYPPGWPAVLAIGVLVGHPELVNPLLAAGTLVLIYLLGKEIYGQSVGLLAAFLGFTSPFFLFMSGSMMSHPSGLFFGTLFLLAFLQTQRVGGTWRSLVAGLAFGMSFLIRPWTAFVFAAPIVVFELPALIREPARLRRWIPALLAVFTAVGIWLGYQAAVTGNPLQNPTELWWPFAKVGFGPDHGPRGFWPIDGIWNTNRNLGELLIHLFGWPPACTLAFALAPFISLRARRVDLQLAAGFLGLVVGYALWWADGIMYGPRFYYEGLAVLVLLTARGIALVASIGRAWTTSQERPLPRVQKWPEHGNRVEKTPNPTSLAARLSSSASAWRSGTDPGRLFVTAIVALLIVGNYLLYMPVQWEMHFGYNYVNRQAVRTVEAAGVGRALVFVPVGEWFAWWNYGSVFSSNSPFLDTQIVYARDLGDVKNRALIAAMPDRTPYRLVDGHVQPYQLTSAE